MDGRMDGAGIWWTDRQTDVILPWLFTVVSMVNIPHLSITRYWPSNIADVGTLSISSYLMFHDISHTFRHLPSGPIAYLRLMCPVPSATEILHYRKCVSATNLLQILHCVYFTDIRENPSQNKLV